MDAVSLCPLPVGSLLWQARPGAWMLTFACKATFELRPVESALAAEQEPINVSDRHWGDDRAWSLYAPSDLVPLCPRADVVLVGHAFAPNGVAVHALAARLLVGDIDKTIQVYGDRSFTQDGVLREGPRFTQMPLLWERAGGGPDTSNPVGMRADARDLYGKRELPNLQVPGVVVDEPHEMVEPVGFGPVASDWPPRRQKLGRDADTWSVDDWHLKPLPPDLDVAYFNSAPRDQQTTALRDNERILLDNLHPEHPHLVTNLPGVRPRAFVDRPDRPPQPAQMRADLLWINTDRGVCTMTWRGQIALRHPRELGAVLVALEEPGKTLAWKDFEHLASRAGVQVHGDPPRGHAGPGAQRAARPGAAAPPPEPTDGDQADTVVIAEDDPDAIRTNTSNEPATAAPVLPFAEAVARPPAPPRTPAQQVVATPFSAPGAPPAAPPLAPRSGARPPPRTRPPAPPRGRPPGSVPAPPPLVRAPPPEDADGGALAASNAAAAVVGAAPPPAQGVEPAPASSPRPAAQRAAPAVTNLEVVDLLWFDRTLLPRIRKKPEWRVIIQALEEAPPDPDLDDASLGSTPTEVEDRRDVFAILAKGGAADAAGVEDALSHAIRADGKIVPPLVLAAGELSFPFDEVETLKTHVALVTPLSSGDEKLRAEIALVKDYLAAPEVGCAPTIMDTLSARLWDAFGGGKRAVPADVLRAHADAVLLQKRRLQKREVFGGSLRALLQAGAGASLPAYVPSALTSALPLYQRFRARVIAEVHPSVDQHETCALALRVVALARIVERVRPMPER